MHARVALFLAFAFAIAPVGAFALDLPTARAQGLVCEQPDGFAAATGPSAASLVGEVNARRREEYTRISQQNGQAVTVVGQLAHAQILAKPGAAACR